MSERLTFLKLSELTLEKARRPLSPNEIWDLSEGIRDRLGSEGKTPAASIGARLYVDVRDNPESKFYLHSKRPTRFYLAKYRNTMSDEIAEAAMLPKTPKFLERDLHPLLIKFIDAHEHFKARSRTIYHEQSSKRGKGHDEWLHPDIVGVYYPYDKFDQKVLEIQRELGSPTVRLFSFEMKINLDLTNIRQAYFQAVSNSSWANEGYLVALNVSPEAEFRDELSRLNNAFGIGVIQLDPQNVDQSEVILPARSKDIDWVTVARLSEANPNFRETIESIGRSMKIMEEHGNYDKCLSDEEYREYAKSKGIVA